jgi:hypothetical protein
MKSYKIFFLSGLTVLLLGLSSCEIEEVPNPNATDLDVVLENPTRSDLQAVVTGIESLMRKEIGFYYDVVSIIGREMYFFTGSDPRYTGELLGKGGSTLDDAGFYGTRPYAGRYAAVKNVNILIEAVQNNAQKLSLTQEEVNAYLGFAKTIQAYELHLVLNLQYQNGIRLDVADPDNLGPFVGYDEALAGIMALLNEGDDLLSKAGSDLPFALSPGFDGFNTPAQLREFNRALAARLALYQGNKSQALTFLEDSFFDLQGDFNMGPARIYSTAGGEVINPVFRSPNQADALVAHPQFIADLAPGDDRASKIQERDDPISLDGLSSTHDVIVFPDRSSPIPFINNEELILIYAEANIGSNNSEAIDALDIIRTTHGLGAYNGGSSDAEVLDELLTQRRFSLYGLGHRWVDLRRYGRLNELPIDRPDDNVWEQFPRPVSEKD